MFMMKDWRYVHAWSVVLNTHNVLVNGPGDEVMQCCIGILRAIKMR